MISNSATKGYSIHESEIFDNQLNYYEYYLLKNNHFFRFLIIKSTDKIIIKCNNYEINLNNNDLSILTKTNLNTIDEANTFLINIFEENKVNIKEIIKNKEMKLELKIYVLNKEKQVELILLYDKRDRNPIISEINNNYYGLKKELITLKDKINILESEINK